MPNSSLRSHIDPAADAAALLGRLGLVVLGIAAPCSALSARRAIFVLMPIGALLVLLAAVLGPRGEGMRHIRAALMTPVGSAVLLLTAWAALSLIWTPFLGEAGARFVKSAGTLALAGAAAAFLPERTRVSGLYQWPVAAALSALGAIILAFANPEAVMQVQFGDDATLERGLIGAVVLLWPALAALALRQRWNSAGLLAGLVAIATIAIWSPLALFGLLTGALALAFCAGKPRRAASVLAALAAAVLVLAPALPFVLRLLPLGSDLDPEGPVGSFMASMATWADLVRGDGWRLLTGHGLDSATRGVFAGYLPDTAPQGLLFEIWFDLGAVGGLAAAFVAAQGFLACGRASPSLAPFMMAGLTSVLTIAMLGLSTAQLWWVTMLAIVLIAFTHVVRGLHHNNRPKLPTMTLPRRMPMPMAQETRIAP